MGFCGHHFLAFIIAGFSGETGCKCPWLPANAITSENWGFDRVCSGFWVVWRNFGFWRACVSGFFWKCFFGNFSHAKKIFFRIFFKPENFPEIFFLEKKFRKNIFPTEKILKTIFTLIGTGAAGGVRINVVKDALKAGADILVVGRAITACKDIKRAADEFVERLDKEEIDQFRIVTDF